MEKEFVPYELALKLKALGFDKPCLGYYLEDGTWTPASYSREGTVYPSNTDLLPEWCAAPLYQQAFRWFREKYELSCSIELTDNSRHYYYDFTISDSKNRDYNDEDCFDSCKTIYDDGKHSTYEKAELACLDKLIELTFKSE